MTSAELPSTMADKSGSNNFQSASSGLPPKEISGAREEVRRIELEGYIARLYERNAAPLLRYALAICGNVEMAQDAVQEVFLRYYIALRNETANRDAKGWLYTTARNYVLDRLKEYFVRNGEGLGAAAHLAASGDKSETQIMLREINATALEVLSPRELECLRLRNEGLRYQDIAEILRIDSATVGVFLARALKKLRAALSP